MVSVNQAERIKKGREIKVQLRGNNKGIQQEVLVGRVAQVLTLSTIHSP